MPQVYARKFNDAKLTFTDDIIFAETKQGLFQLVIFLRTAKEVEQALVDLKAVNQYSPSQLQFEEATILIQDVEAEPLSAVSDANIARIATGEEFAADPILCKGRPEPKYYDEHRMWSEMQQKRYVIVRSDRFVYAACNDRSELIFALKELSALHNGRNEQAAFPSKL